MSRERSTLDIMGQFIKIRSMHFPESLIAESIREGRRLCLSAYSAILLPTASSLLLGCQVQWVALKSPVIMERGGGGPYLIRVSVVISSVALW
jgi:hypothetical protein